MAKRVSQNVGLQPVERQALLFLAKQRARPGDDPNVSATVAEMIDRRMREEYGPDWRTIFPAIQARQPMAVAS